MAYIVVVNPQILAQAGMPVEGVVFATCVASAAATLVMGLYANYPIALAPGMSLNAYFTYSVCLGMHVPWQTALGVIFFSGVFFLVLTVTRVREQIVNGIPECLKYSTAGGIGMFIAFVGLRNAKLVVANPATFVSLGSFADHEAQMACVGLGIMLVLMTRKVSGAILIGIFSPLRWEFCVEWRSGHRQFFHCRTPLPPGCNSICAARCTSDCWKLSSSFSLSIFSTMW